MVGFLPLISGIAQRLRKWEGNFCRNYFQYPFKASVFSEKTINLLANVVQLKILFLYLPRIYGTKRRGQQSPFLLKIMDLKEEITKLVEEQIATTGHFLVETKVSSGKVLVLIDHPVGVKIEDCVRINRHLQNHFENSNVFETHELEVGSPGMEEPLKVIPQFTKRLGQEVSVLTLDGLKRTGTLLNVDENGIDIDETTVIKTGNKKEKQKQQHNIPFTNIKETRVIFSFDKIK